MLSIPQRLRPLIALAAFLALVPIGAAQICGSDIGHGTRRVEAKSPLEKNPPADKALVYVIAPTWEVGSKQMKVSADRNWIGVNQDHTYFVAALDPGEHELCSKWGNGNKVEQVARLKLSLEPGRAYYVLQHSSVGFQVSSELTQVSPEDAAVLLRRCKRIEFFEKK